ncbi:MAG: deoxyribose-phosphate aldolase [Deltaproteobacteria bacterium]|nr:deoxyribose-phosphate aldolase [Deltaproteobacteria bacterium]
MSASTPSTTPEAQLPSPAPFIEHTLLHPLAGAGDIRRLCAEACRFGFASVCVAPLHVSLAAELLADSSVRVGTVVGFPLGYTLPAVKIFETAELVRCGATELDMVISLAKVRDGDFAAVGKEVAAVVSAARGVPVKAIIECCYLDETQKVQLAELVAENGAAFVKTSTGFGSAGALVEDVRLLARAAKGRIGVKAAGGIRSWEECRRFLAAGATRIGTSSAPRIMEEWRGAAAQ